MFRKAVLINMLLRESTASTEKCMEKVSGVLVFYKLYCTYKGKVNLSFFTSRHHVGGTEV